jgi:cell division protease FtsH
VIIDAWLPIGHVLPGGYSCGRALFAGSGWQIVELGDRGRALLAHADLTERWIAAGLLAAEQMPALEFGRARYRALVSNPHYALAPAGEAKSPDTKSAALAFAVALKSTRAIDQMTSLEDAIFAEAISRLLPTYTNPLAADDAAVLGRWLTGGANISAKSFDPLHRLMSWLPAAQLKEVLATAGVEAAGVEVADGDAAAGGAAAGGNASTPRAAFNLPGRPELAAFFNEHVVDIVQNRARYKSLGIGFPSAILLQGPPGCGKTYAVEQLIEYLGWPSYRIDAGSVASPYIHETSKKVAAVFDNAMQNAPSVLVIDEMEAFLADREIGSAHHRVEEVAEFLRKIPEAVKNEVLIVAMTNRIEMIDPAILRRGRFDHIVKVSYASETEVFTLLSSLLSSLPTAEDVDALPLAKALSARPLSDVTFVVRDAARRAARSGSSKISQRNLLDALHNTPAIDPDSGKRNPIGFV